MNEEPGQIVPWVPMEYWEFFCGLCGKGLFMESAVEAGFLLGRCRNQACVDGALVVKVALPSSAHETAHGGPDAR